MLRYLVKVSLENRFVVVLLAAALVAVGVAIGLKTPLDVFPEFAPPLVDVQTEAPGMSSEAVEQLVTNRIESALEGLPRMTVIRSKSVQGLSQVVMIFERGTNLYEARQMVTERVAVVAPLLPTQTKPPRLLPMLSSTSRVMHIGLTPKRKEDLKTGERQLDLTDVSVAMKWIVEPRLLAVPGVANVSTYGMTEKEYQILVKPADLKAYGVSLAQVKQAAKKAVVYGSPGYHDSENQRLGVLLTTNVEKAQDLAETVVAHVKNQPVTLGQVATLSTGNPPAIGGGVSGRVEKDGAVRVSTGLFVVVEKYPWANTLEVTHATEEAMKLLAPAIPGIEVNLEIFRPASFIELALANLNTAMIIGCVLVALILVAFLFEWRAAVISLTAIPFSLLTAVVLLNRMGATLNTMVLAGLAIAIGEVVDDAIIDVENIVRRLKQNGKLPPGQRVPILNVVLEASLEVRSAVVYASLIVCLVCLPIFFLGGVAGSFFQPLALAYILAIMASLGVALVITPAMSLILLPGVVDRHRDAPLVRWTRAGYRRVLPLFLNRPVIVLSFLVALLGGAVFLYPRLKEEYLPQFQESDFLMHWVAKPGTSIKALERDIVTVGEEMLRESPVKAYGSHIARAEVGEEVVGPNFAELWVSIGNYKGDYKKAREQIEDVMARHPGFQYDLLTYLQERIKEVLSGTGATVVLRTYGPDLAKLRDQAGKIKQAIEGGPDGKVEGVVDLNVESQVLVPQLELRVDPYRARAHGLTPADVFDSVSTLLNGTHVGEIHKDRRAFALVVRGHPDVYANLTDLRRMEIDLPNGQGMVPLDAVADLRLVNALNAIRHDQAFRCIDVSCNIKDRDLGSVVHDIQQRIAPLALEGYRTEVLGEYQARAENQRQLLGVSLLSLIGIALLLFVDFKSLRLTFMVLLTLPFALIGGVFAAYFTGGVLSLGSLVGFITVLGICARNGIMMVSHYKHLQTDENVPFGRGLILQGAEERVSPILMTALAAGLGLLPLAISGNKPGYEVEYPMAMVILGGLFTSTLLNLLVLPVLFERFGRVRWAAEAVATPVAAQVSVNGNTGVADKVDKT
jgi:CzcA family heavy metal efflux pump